MLTIEQGLSERVMYPLLLENGSCKYYTKDGVIAYKEKLDKKLKRYGIMNAIKWGLFVFCIMYFIGYLVLCVLLKSRVDYEGYHTITGILKFPTIFMVPLCVWVPRIHFIDDHHMFLFKRFKETYGEYFDFHKRWNKINMKCDGRILGIQSLINDIELRQH